MAIYIHYIIRFSSLFNIPMIVAIQFCTDIKYNICRKCIYKGKGQLYSKRDGKVYSMVLDYESEAETTKTTGKLHNRSEIGAFQSGCSLVLALAHFFFYVARYSKIQQRLESQFHFRNQAST